MTTRTSFVVLAAALAASLLCGCETVSSPVVRLQRQVILADAQPAAPAQQAAPAPRPRTPPLTDSKKDLRHETQDLPGRAAASAGRADAERL